MILKLAWRNLVRNRRRSVLTALTLIAGFVVLAFSLGLSEGGYDRIIAMFTDMKTGHVQITHSDYIDNPSLFKTVKFDQSRLDRIANVNEVSGVAARLEAGALAFFNDATIGVYLIGVQKDGEPTISSIVERIDRGSWLENSGNYEAVIGARVAKQLNIEVGEKLVLISQGGDGSIANDFFTVKAILRSNAMDDYGIVTDLMSAQEFLTLSGRAHRIVIRANHFSYSYAVQASILQAVSFTDTEKVSNWQTIEKDFVTSMEADKQGNNILYIIIGMVAGLGVLNTVLMSLLERRREFGVLKAIGTRPDQLFRMIMSEVFLLSGSCCLIGTIIAYVVNSYFAYNGIKFPEPVEFGGIYIDEMVSTTDMRAFVMPAVVTMTSAVLVAILPAWRAAHANVIAAMGSR